MGKIKEITIDRFDGGVVNDPRSDGAVCRIVTGFDILTNRHKMTPYPNSVDGDNAATTSRKQNFCVGDFGGTPYLYGLGVKSGAATAEVLRKALTTGGSNDLSDAGWAAPANNQATSGNTLFDLFTYYKGKIFGAAGQYIWSYDTAGGAWSDTEHNMLATIASVTEGVVHSKDDILYIGLRNSNGSYIIKRDAGIWSTALTLPTYLEPTSICEYGNYLGILCAPVSGVGKSVLYIWDRDSSLETVSETVDFGSGVARIVEELSGYLVVIGIAGNNTIRVKDRVEFQMYSGVGGARFVGVLEDTTGLGSSMIYLPKRKQKINQRLYFMMAITLHGARREGTWSLGLTGDRWTLVHERTPNNDTALTTGIPLGFHFIGDYLFQAYISNNVYAVSKTTSTGSFTASSIWEDKIFNDGDSSKRKKLVGVTIITEPLPQIGDNVGQVIVKYRKDEETAFTTVMTHNTANALSKSTTKNAAGAALPEFKEIGFRLESQKGAVITALKFRFEELDKDVY
jgi:hypothetical protein